LLSTSSELTEARYFKTQFMLAQLRCGRFERLQQASAEPESILVNDIHSQLNSTRVLGISQPQSLEDVQASFVAPAKREVISVSGDGMPWRQQFGTDTLLIDTRS